MIQSDQILTSSPTFKTLFSGSLVAFGAVYLSGMIAAKIGGLCEDAIDSHQAISGLRINPADDKALQEFSKANRKNIWAASVSVVGMIFVNLFSVYTAKLIGIG
ncbi:hypothetical protein [Nitrosococcus wardiae]|uniref:Uncharacterized protein n=1 Tax=Nitrosococcus wardiae TaxID=1814290 RepID=A0A4P7C238_9GAMM|nr:hypothetical protein [Nitrosococcus wardiae]QBQ54952.1 hypothetical protein E3U44_10815 [Nitrosococcus wardiae]